MGELIPARDASKVDAMARALMAEWERVEDKPVTASYVATFVDLARVALAGTARVCGCRADTELAAGSGCTVCGHRDHGRSGCLAPAQPGEVEPNTLELIRIAREAGRAEGRAETVSEAALYDALWSLKRSHGDDSYFPTLPEVHDALDAAFSRSATPRPPSR